MTTTDVPGPSGGTTIKPIVRPRGAKFLWYCLGGSLPEQHSTWVLADVTCRTWLLRHFARTMLIVVPLFAAYMALMPTSFVIRLLTGLTFSGGLIMFSLVNALVDTDRRAVRAGYGAGLPAQLRTQQSVDRQRLASSQRRARIAERQARRRGGN
jgi:hypothetical protein